MKATTRPYIALHNRASITVELRALATYWAVKVTP